MTYLKIKIFNHLMISGKKKTCEKKVLKSLKSLQKGIKKNHLNIIKLAIINSISIIKLKEIKQKKKKTVTKFPFFFNKNNRVSFSLKSIVFSLKQKFKTNMYLQLNQELLSNSQNQSDLIKKKIILQDYALTQKKYSHYRWFC